MNDDYPGCFSIFYNNGNNTLSGYNKNKYFIFNFQNYICNIFGNIFLCSVYAGEKKRKKHKPDLPVVETSECLFYCVHHSVFHWPICSAKLVFIIKAKR